ncbi:C4-dicarboxylate TRAP transporter large permease protein DctM [subsurface metagenome]
MFAFLALGLPVAFAMGGSAVLFALLMTPRTLMALPVTFFSISFQHILLTVPMFIFMGSLVRYSGIADDAYDMAYKLLGALGGGLAMGTVIICTFFAAITGITPPATITMGMIAIPSMLKHKYHKTIAIGSVAAGGALGALIPPSVPFIFYAILARESVGALFMGGVMPGLLLAALYVTYIGIRCKLQPHMGPGIPLEEKVSWGERIRSVTALWPFLALIFLVLGVIYMGVATPTEAACFGAGGALVINALYRRLTWQVLKDSLITTVRLTVMGNWILIGATVFINVFSALGCQDVVTSTVLGMPGGKWGVLAMMMVIILILGCVMDDWAIIMLCTPLYVPIITALGFSKLWFGIIFIVNIQIAYLTPPFGFVLFWLKGIVPPGVTMADIYRSTLPFVILQLIGLSLVIIFPQIGLWLPNKMIK